MAKELSPEAGGQISEGAADAADGGTDTTPDLGTVSPPTIDQLEAKVEEIKNADETYHESYLSPSRDLNTVELEEARASIEQMRKLADEMYILWRGAVTELPPATEVTTVINGLRGGLQWRERLRSLLRGRLLRAIRPSLSMGSLVDLNERVRVTTDLGYETLSPLLFMVLDARHYEMNCERLTPSEASGRGILASWAREKRLELETILAAVQGGVDAQRAQAQALSLYAQTHIALQVRFLNWLLGIITVILLLGALGIAVYQLIYAGKP